LAEPAFQIKEEVSEEHAARVSGSALIEIDALLRKEENALELCESMIDIAAALFNVPSKDIRLPGRTPTPVSRVRQVAMYVAHVVLGLSMGEVGRGFGRDRKTVQHACHVIEDMRDDPEFDHIVAQTERVAAIALRNRIPR
jgi:chromosomal replication initiation ATPase DnaA